MAYWINLNELFWKQTAAIENKESWVASAVVKMMICINQLKVEVHTRLEVQQVFPSTNVLCMPFLNENLLG